MKKILLLSAHPDDIELAMGGYFIRLMKEKNYYIGWKLLTDCGILNENEKAVKFIGFNITFNKPILKVRELNKYRTEILQDLYDYNKTEKPDVVFCPSMDDTHQDHQVLAEEAYRVFKHTTLISYIHPHNCRTIRPNYFIELTDEELQKKIELLSIYKSQLGKNYMTKDSIIGTAAFYGAMTGRKYCEAFEILRKFD